MEDQAEYSENPEGDEGSKLTSSLAADMLSAQYVAKSQAASVYQGKDSRPCERCDGVYTLVWAGLFVSSHVGHG